MKLLLLKGSSEYGVLRSFVDHLSPAIEACGHETAIYDAEKRFGSNHALPKITGNVDAIITFNSMGTNLRDENGEKTFEILGTPVISWLVDHPAYHYPRLNNNIPKKLNLVASDDHQQYILDANISGQCHTLLAGGLEKNSALKDYRIRQHRAVFAATFMGEPIPFWREQYDANAGRIMEQAIEILVADPLASPYNALVYAYGQAGIAIKPGAIVSDMISHMLTFIRCRDRIETMRSLASSGLPVTVIGKGWESYLRQHGALRFSPEVSIDQLLDLYGDSQIVMNFNAANGACERAFSGMLAGAAVLSDRNQTLEKTMRTGTNIVFYDRAISGDLVEVLGSMMDPAIGEQIAAEGQREASRSHRWVHRAEKICEWIEQDLLRESGKAEVV
jgi:hypothetical protein